LIYQNIWNEPMTETFAILYICSSKKEREKLLIKKFSNIISRFDFGKTNIKVNPKIPIQKFWEKETNSSITLIIGWGRYSKPTWEILIPNLTFFNSLRQFIAVDLYEREGFDGKILKNPKANAGKYWSQKMKWNNRNLFFDGYFLQSSVPYGLKRVPALCTGEAEYHSNTAFVFEPGEPTEVEMVRMIFDLFVTHDYNRTEISSLLNAQEIKAPKRSNVWNTRIITTILESPFYIGANQYRGFVKYDVFTPIIEKPIYYEAQAKISQLNLLTGRKNIK
jgi:hypothetical protein